MVRDWLRKRKDAFVELVKGLIIVLREIPDFYAGLIVRHNRDFIEFSQCMDRMTDNMGQVVDQQSVEEKQNTNGVEQGGQK